jgi:hypothetical protein
LLLLEVVQSALAMIEVVLPEPSVNLVIFLVVENSESLSGLRRVPLSPVDVAILVLQGQLLNFLVLWVLRVVLIVAPILRIVLPSLTVCIRVVLINDVLSSLDGVCKPFLQIVILCLRTRSLRLSGRLVVVEWLVHWQSVMRSCIQILRTNLRLLLRLLGGDELRLNR